MTDTDFRTKLDALIGQPTGGSGKPTVAPDPVNQPMIRHWAHALADMNPVYLDPEFAEKSRFGGIVSPPVMLQAWTMPAPKIEGIAERGGVPIEIDKNNNPAEFINEAGFTGIVATNSEFEIERYPRLGDVISVTTVSRTSPTRRKPPLVPATSSPGCPPTPTRTVKSSAGNDSGCSDSRRTADGDQTGTDDQPG